MSFPAGDEQLMMTELLTEKAMQQQDESIKRKIQTILDQLHVERGLDLQPSSDSINLDKRGMLPRNQQKPEIKLEAIKQEPIGAKVTTLETLYVYAVTGGVATGITYAGSQAGKGAGGALAGRGGAMVGRIGGSIIGGAVADMVKSELREYMLNNIRKRNQQSLIEAAFTDQDQQVHKWFDGLIEVEREYYIDLAYIFRWYSANLENDTPIDRADFYAEVSAAFNSYQGKLDKAIQDLLYSRIGELKRALIFNDEQRSKIKDFFLHLTAYRYLSDSMIRSTEFFKRLISAKAPDGWRNYILNSLPYKILTFFIGVAAVACIVGSIGILVMGSGPLSSLVAAACIFSFLSGLRFFNNLYNAYCEREGYDLRYPYGARIEAAKVGNALRSVGKQIRVLLRLNKEPNRVYINAVKKLKASCETGIFRKDADAHLFLGDKSAWIAEARAVSASVNDESRKSLARKYARLQEHAQNVEKMCNGSADEKVANETIIEIIKNTRTFKANHPELFTNRQLNLLLKVRLQIINIFRTNYNDLTEDAQQALKTFYVFDLSGDEEDLHTHLKLDMQTQNVEALRAKLYQKETLFFCGSTYAWTKFGVRELILRGNAPQRWRDMTPLDLVKQIKQAKVLLRELAADTENNQLALIYQTLISQQVCDLLLNVYNDTSHEVHRTIIERFLSEYINFNPRFIHDYYHLFMAEETNEEICVAFFLATQSTNSPQIELLDCIRNQYQGYSLDEKELKEPQELPLLGLDYMIFQRMSEQADDAISFNVNMTIHNVKFCRKPPRNPASSNYYAWLLNQINHTKALIDEMPDGVLTNLSETKIYYLSHVLLSTRYIFDNINHFGRSAVGKKREELVKVRQLLCDFILQYESFLQDSFRPHEVETYQRYSTPPAVPFYLKIIYVIGAWLGFGSSSQQLGFYCEGLRFATPNPLDVKSKADTAIILATLNSPSLELAATTPCHSDDEGEQKGEEISVEDIPLPFKPKALQRLPSFYFRDGSKFEQAARERQAIAEKIPHLVRQPGTPI